MLNWITAMVPLVSFLAALRILTEGKNNFLFKICT